MNIIIVGAGIAGLGAGIALRKGGHKVTILERSSLSQEVGAAISIAPNASKVLASWGFDIVKARMVAFNSAKIFNGTSMKCVVPNYHANIDRRFGSKIFGVHRADLHDQLRALATDQHAPGTPCKLLTSSKVDSYDVTNASVKLVDGTVYDADLVIAADGTHSTARAYVLNEGEDQLSNTSWGAMRWILSSEEISSDPATASLLEDSAQRLFVGANGGALVWYNCRDNSIQNLLYLSKAFEGSAASEEYHVPIEVDQMMEYARKDFGASLQAVLAKAKDVTFWSLVSRVPTPRWHKERLLLLGDAAHPMLPFQAQGGAQAIEDAAALGILLGGVDDVTLLQDRMQLFEQVRRDRGSMLQILSNGPPPLPDTIFEEASRYSRNVKLSTNEDIEEEVYSFDVVERTKEVLAKAQL